MAWLSNTVRLIGVSTNVCHNNTICKYKKHKYLCSNYGQFYPLSQCPWRFKTELRGKVSQNAKLSSPANTILAFPCDLLLLWGRLLDGGDYAGGSGLLSTALASALLPPLSFKIKGAATSAGPAPTHTAQRQNTEPKCKLVYCGVRRGSKVLTSALQRCHVDKNLGSVTVRLPGMGTGNGGLWVGGVEFLCDQWQKIDGQWIRTGVDLKISKRKVMVGLVSCGGCIASHVNKIWYMHKGMSSSIAWMNRQGYENHDSSPIFLN